jgi:hypothetical protein
MGCASSAKSREPMAGKVEGLDELVKQIGRIGDFPKDMRKELRKGNRDIGRMASKRVKPQVPRSGKVFNVYEGSNGKKRKSPGQGVVRLKVSSGTLRRSIGVRNSRGSRINVFVGPRSGGVAEKNDGWFAGIVESGHVGGRNKSTNSRNFNKIAPALDRLRPAMERLMIIKYRKAFDKFKL